MLKPQYISVVKTYRHQKYNHLMAECICQCGKTFKSRLHAIQIGKTSSCGCYHDLRLRTHGHARSKTVSLTYRSWVAMKNRCNNPNSADYYNYGAIGVKVCERWANDFELFMADMGERPSRNYSLDRIDTFGDYSPDNCRWATAKEQANNRKRKVLFDFRGARKTLTQIAQELGTSRQAIRYRIKAGWPMEKVFQFNTKENEV